MRLLLKYILILTYLVIISWVALSSRIPNEVFLWILIAVVVVAGFVLMRNIVSKERFSKIFFIGTFLLLIYIPVVGPKETTSFENRTLTPFPEFRASNVWKFFFQYQEYFNDRFTFRNIAVRTISKFRFKLFGVSPMPQIVNVGKNGWLNSCSSKYVNETSIPFTKEQLDSVILNLKIITKYFDERNIKYYFAMLPVKERVYPEYMSSLLKLRMQHSKAEQLNSELKKHPDIRSIDVKDVLIQSKKIRPTYYTIDTHWNEYGAFLGYRQIIERIKQDFPQIVPTELNEYKIDSVNIKGGDLQLLMGFSDALTFNRYVMTHRTKPQPIIIDSTNYVPGSTSYSIREMPQPVNGLKLFLVRDSFSEHLRTFITPDFDRTVLAWMPVVPVAVALQEKPDIILHQILEHFVMSTLELPAEIKSDTVFLKQNFPDYLK